jgi:hypothetical protein
MNTTAVSLEMSEQSGYGAVELKQFINKFTVRGFVITVSIFLVLLLLYIGLVKVSEMRSNQFKTAPIVKLKLENLPPPPTNADEAPPPPTEQI